MTRVRTHLETALAHLNLDDELDRLINPRHTDHDRHAFLPRKLADEISKAREEVQAALDELPKDAP
jgi:MoxR-like ATPase